MRLFIIALFGTLLACNENASISGENGEEYALNDDAFGFVELEKASIGVEFNANTNVTGNSATQSKDAKIIKTADIEFESKDLEETYVRIRKLVASQRGSLQLDDTGKNYDQIYRRLTIRVPSENFQELVDGIVQGVSHFDTKKISEKDVGAEFVDLSARLKAKRKLEERYLQLLTKAKNVEEMLKIERELAQIREEIEAKQGRLNYLQNRVSLSTIDLRFYERIEPVEVAQLSFGGRIINALEGGWNGVLNFFVGMLYIWPFLLIGGVAFFLIRRYLRRSRTATPS